MTLAERDAEEVGAIMRELSEPLAAIVSNAQAGQRMLATGGRSWTDRSAVRHCRRWQTGRWTLGASRRVTQGSSV